MEIKIRETIITYAEYKWMLYLAVMADIVRQWKKLCGRYVWLFFPFTSFLYEYIVRRARVRLTLEHFGTRLHLAPPNPKV